ncbi:conserved membrane hypothetical protein [metagenome]|uniref:Uncharacterized protein n=1 Tax=metagenome TaxID=256318 RepID=A0A2P2C4V1_9ZZZZ
MRTRVLVAAPGVMMGLYGLYLLIDLGLDNLLATALWAAGGVVAHDGVLAPVVLLGCLLGLRVLPAAARAPAAVALVVLGTLTVVAIPVLGRFGARPDNPTLLDRDYVPAWLAIAGLTLLAAVLAGVLASRSRPTTRSGGGQGSRGR